MLLVSKLDMPYDFMTFDEFIIRPVVLDHKKNVVARRYKWQKSVKSYDKNLTIKLSKRKSTRKRPTCSAFKDLLRGLIKICRATASVPLVDRD